MSEHCENEQFVNTKAGGGATSSPLLDLDRGLVVVLKRHVLSWSPSPAVLLLGSLIIFSPLIEGGTTHAPVLIMRLLLLGALAVWTIHQMRVGVIVLMRSRLILVVVDSLQESKYPMVRQSSAVCRVVRCCPSGRSDEPASTANCHGVGGNGAL
jgi:hypothetical protein